MKKLLILVLALMMAVLPTRSMADSLLPYGGEEVVYKGFWDEYTVSWDAAINTVTELDRCIAMKWGNVRVEWEPVFGDASQKLNLMMSTGDLPDIIVTTSMFSKLRQYDMSYFLDFSQYADYAPNIMAAYEELPALNNLRGPNGETWWMPQQVRADSVGEIWYVNGTALAEMGAEAPTTWAEAMELMRAYKKANPRKYPLLHPYGWGLQNHLGFIGNVTGMQSAGIYYDDQEKTWKHAPSTEGSKMKETVALMAELIEEGLLESYSYDRPTEQGYDVMRKGDWLIAMIYINTPFTEVFKEQYEEVTLDIQPLAMSDVYMPLVYRAGMYDYDGGLLNADIPHPELAVSLVDSWQSMESQMMATYGIEGVTYERTADGGIRWLPEYDSVEARAAFGLGECIEITGMFSYIFWQPVALPANAADQLLPHEKVNRIVLSWEREGTVPILTGNPYTALLTADDGEIVSANLAPINTFIEEGLYAFVEGWRPMSDWDKFIELALNYGDIDTVLEVYNSVDIAAYSNDLHWMDMPVDW